MPDQNRAQEPGHAPEEHRSRSLVPLGTLRRSEERPLACFLAQLIACERRLPAYRPARMAEPSLAASRYGVGRPPARLTLDRKA